MAVRWYTQNDTEVPGDRLPPALVKAAMLYEKAEEAYEKALEALERAERAYDEQYSSNHQELLTLLRELYPAVPWDKFSGHLVIPQLE